MNFNHAENMEAAITCLSALLALQEKDYSTVDLYLETFEASYLELGCFLVVLSAINATADPKAHLFFIAQQVDAGGDLEFLALFKRTVSFISGPQKTPNLKENLSLLEWRKLLLFLEFVLVRSTREGVPVLQLVRQLRDSLILSQAG